MTERDGPPPTLSTASVVIAVAIVLAVFTLLNPIWLEQDVGAWSDNVWYSYLPVPFVVGVLLAIERKFNRGSLFVESMKVGLVKFAITFVVANVIWAVRGPPGSGAEPMPPPAVERGVGRFEPSAAPEPSELDRDTLGTIAGQVVDGDGEPMAGAFVSLVTGLGRRRFPVPDEPLELKIDEGGFAPQLAVVQAYRRVVLVSGDDRLHTAVFSDPASDLVINYPVLAGGRRELMFRRDYGVLVLSCSVHGEEQSARVAVVDHPFAVISDAAGRFTLAGVPEGEVTLEVVGPDDATALHTVAVVGQGEVSATVTLP